MYEFGSCLVYFYATSVGTHTRARARIEVIVVGCSSSSSFLLYIHIIFSLFKLIRLIYIFGNYSRFFVSFSLLLCCKSHLRVTYETLVCVRAFFRYICDSTETRMCHSKTIYSSGWLHNRTLFLLSIFRWVGRFFLYLNTFSLVSRLWNIYNILLQYLFQGYYLNWTIK